MRLASCIFILMFVGYLVTVKAQDQISIFPSIEYLEVIPKIDGKPDAALKGLTERSFNVVFTEPTSFDAATIHYRIGYNVDFLYLIIEVDSDSIISHDRAYQNGDGFHMVLGKAKEDNLPANEFYVMGFSSLPDNQQDHWTRKFFWYHDVDLAMKQLSSDVLFEISTSNNKTYYELLLPWSEVYPYHPWLSDELGFNLCFVKSYGDNQRSLHYIVYDEKIQSELSLRKYALLRFSKLKTQGQGRAYAILERNNLFENQDPKIRLALNATDSDKHTLFYSIYSGEGNRINSGRLAFTPMTDHNQYSFPMEANDLVHGGYKIKWRLGENTGETYLSVINEIDFNHYRTKVHALEGISEGTKSTYLFRLNKLEEQLQLLKPNQLAGKERIEAERLTHEYFDLMTGNDMYASKRGIFRRGFLSMIDSTYQPYTIKVPLDYHPDSVYPLFVFLHGSGVTDEAYWRYPDFTEGKCIEVAPFGRGTSTAYSTPESQYDIMEVIDDVIRNYSIDTSNLILAGFSMGGYGVYRTHYEYPDRYKALAIFAGHPDLANKWDENKTHPNFLQYEYLESFAEKDMFIFHGTLDRNCPAELTDNLVSYLKLAGAKVTYETEDVGHTMPSEKVMDRFRKWMKEVVNSQ